MKVQRELDLDECAIHALTEDRKNFLCKAVENYISCLLSGEEHDMWIFRLCSLWLENSGVDRVNEMMKVCLLLFFFPYYTFTCNYPHPPPPPVCKG